MAHFREFDVYDSQHAATRKIKSRIVGKGLRFYHGRERHRPGFVRLIWFESADGMVRIEAEGSDTPITVSYVARERGFPDAVTEEVVRK